MIAESTATRPITSAPMASGVIHAFTIATGLSLQLASVYASAVTFGAWITFALYAAGGLATFLQHARVRRITSCSSGE